jgi:hypothetical protein
MINGLKASVSCGSSAEYEVDALDMTRKSARSVTRESGLISIIASPRRPMPNHLPCESQHGSPSTTKLSTSYFRRQRSHSFDDTVTRIIFFPGQLHPVLRYESCQQSIHWFHDAEIAVNFKAAVFFNRTNSLILHITGDDA